MNLEAADVVVCSNCERKNRIPAAATGVPRCANCQSPLPWVTSANDDSFAEVVEASALPVLLDLWAPWCGPCRMVSPALELLARENAGRVKLVKVNVDEARNLARRFEAQSIPTLVVLSGGEVLARHVGAVPASLLRPWLAQALSQS